MRHFAPNLHRPVQLEALAFNASVQKRGVTGAMAVLLVVHVRYDTP